MRIKPMWTLGLTRKRLGALLAVPMLALGADVETTAMRDARALASCIKAADLECILSFQYQPNPGAQTSTSRADQIADIQSRYGHAESGPPLVEFAIGGPSPEFSGESKRFIFMPYSKQYWMPGVSVAASGFLIGVSLDNGRTWKFVDNWRGTEDAVRLVYQGYAGQPPIPKVGEMTIGHAPALMPK
jgi:hypothetical protein